MKYRKIQRVIAVLAATTLLAAGVAGCGANGTSQDTDDSSTAEETQDDADEADTGEVTVIHAATSGSPRPFTYVDEEGNLAGHNIELIQAVFDRLPQYELEIEVTEFASIFTGIDAGLFDLGVNNIAKNEEREKNYLYTDPEMVNHYIIVANKDIELDEIKDLTELAGKTFIGTAGNDKTTIIENYNEEHPDQQINIEYNDGDTQSWFQLIEDGRIDFTITDEPMYYGYYEPELHYDVNAYDLNNVASATYSYFIVAKDNTQLAEDINQALAEVIADGTSTEICEKYFGKDYSPGITE